MYCQSYCFTEIKCDSSHQSDLRIQQRCGIRKSSEKSCKKHLTWTHPPTYKLFTQKASLYMNIHTVSTHAWTHATVHSELCLSRLKTLICLMSVRIKGLKIFLCPAWYPTWYHQQRYDPIEPCNLMPLTKQEVLILFPGNHRKAAQSKHSCNSEWFKWWHKHAVMDRNTNLVPLVMVRKPHTHMKSYKGLCYTGTRVISVTRNSEITTCSLWH